MPDSKVDKDEVTGVETTGHEWDGIKELNNPLPSWWVYTFYATIAYALLWWVLFPAIPFGPSATGGLLGGSAREQVTAAVDRVDAQRAEVRQQLVGADLETIRADSQLFTYALTGGRIAFGDNCAPCHGVGGTGQLNYPVLADDAWIWGGTLDEIQHTIRYGIRNQEYELDARYSIMPSFGSDGILTPEEIDQVAAHVVTLNGREAPDPALAEAGAEVFELNCSACHGYDGEGLVDVGAPALNDQVWLYGGELQDIQQQLWQPRHGVMPGWVDRLDEGTIKMLALYVHSLGGGR